MPVLEFLNGFFFVFHSLLILFNLFGWIARATRRWNLALLSLTGVSWFGLGMIYGIGYCPFTDWHWRIRVALGRPDMPNSYVKFLLDSLTPWDWNSALVDAGTAVAFFLALLASLAVNIRDLTAARSKRGLS